jgi:hypothetical protein
VLDAIRNMIPGANRDDSKIGTRALEGAIVGGAAGLAVGAFGGPVGMVGGAVIGGAGGVAAGFMESIPEKKLDRESEDFVKAQKESTAAAATGELGYFAGAAQPSIPVRINLNVDGRTLAQAEAVIDLTGGTAP